MRGLVQQFHRVCRFIQALVAAPFMPQAGVGAQVFPFAAVCHRNSVADITTEGLAVRIVDHAFQPAIYIRGWRVEMVE